MNVIPGLWLLCLAAGAFAAPSVDFAPSVPIVESFFISETALVQERSEFQISQGYASESLESALSPSIQTDVEYGLTDRLQVEVGIPYNVLNAGDDSPEGSGDTEVGMLYAWANRPSFTSVIGFGVGIPSRDARRRTGEAGASGELSLRFGRTLGRTQVHLCLGREFSEEGNRYTYSLAAAHPLGSMIPTFELSGQTGSETSLYCAPGLHYPLPHGYHVRFGIPVRLSGSSGKFSFLGKATLEF